MGTTATVAVILAVLVTGAATLSTATVLIPQASAQTNPCEQIGHFKSNPNCFNPPGCAEPCPPEFKPGLAGNKP
ncbi:MAG TPA: hypothetical protein VJ729_10360 [Nitrososphaeraceae archaeon]|nr:hypothetical protein [Nitrososphaeraceae archaeon]